MRSVTLSGVGWGLVQVLTVYLLSRVLLSLSKRFFFKLPLDHLPGPSSPSLLSGNISHLLNLTNGIKYHRQILDLYGGTMRITGALGERILLTCDPRALHHILVKDQHVYEMSTGIIKRVEILIGPGLITTLGEKHKKQRKLMNPVFSINHMRDLIPLFYEVTERLRTTLRNKVKDGSKEIDILHWMSRTALELIGQSGMGYSFDTLTDDEVRHPYPQSMKKLSLLNGGAFGFFSAQFIFPFAARFNFPRFKRFIVEHIPWSRVQEIKRLINIMYHTSLEIINAKKNALSSSDPAVAKEMMMKKDLISILMRANLEADEADRITDEELYAQISTFVFAGMETTSSAMSRILHLLSIHVNVQERVRNEIREAQANGQLTYDQLVSLPYLDAVCRETLRVYPPVNIAGLRTARKDTVLPLSKPVMGLDGKEITELTVSNGTNIIISVLGSNTNPDLWGPDAQEWKPERWLSPLPKEVGEAHIPGVYSHLMTFLAGGRSCIGFKFSQLEMKVVLAVLLSTFKFEASEKHEITWKATNIANPYVESLDSTRPRLPLIMSLVDEHQ